MGQFLTSGMSGASPLGSLIGSAFGDLMGSAPTSQTTTGASSGTSSNTSSTSGGNTTGATSGSTTNPDLPSWYNTFIQSLPTQYQQQMAQAQTPVLGAQQQANYIQGVNQSYGNAMQQQMSQMAKSGQLNSGTAAQAMTGLQQGKLGNINQYMANVPLQNAQFSQQYGNQLLGQGMNFKAPYGQTSTGFNNAFQNYLGNSTSSNQQQQQQQSTTKNSGSGLMGALGF